MLIPSIVTIEFDLRFKTLKYLFLAKSLILEMALLLTSSQSRCKGASFTSNIEISSLLVALTFIKYFKPERYFKDFSLLYDRSTSSKY